MARVYGAFTLLVVVNGQDVRVQCSMCGLIRESVVDRSEGTEAAMRAHIASHIHYISKRAAHYNPVRQPQPFDEDE
jgi:hypothetical protein